ncbi:Ultraviolet N-glycosylase/AP lyase [compost metagenome]
MDLFNESTDWAAALKPLIVKYKDKKHPLDYKNLYQLLVMVVLSAQDSDAHINKIAPELFKAFPNMKSLAEADEKSLLPYIEEVRFHGNKLKWLLEIAENIKQDKNIPLTMKELTALKGIGRKSANVIMREAGAAPEGIMADLHVVRVAPRLGIAKAKDADKIEKEMMEVLPKSMWSEAGLAISFLGRETCRPTNPKHSECIMNSVCEFYNNKKGGQN